MANTRTDFGAAITGLIVGGCVLFVLLFGVVELTNHKYAGEEAAAAEASPSTPATLATPAPPAAAPALTPAPTPAAPAKK